ncbi:MAG TPA: hypothetical protein VEK83_02075 [Gemmatimonadales bacterium]|nr:hypothetical protein [Gemmatimonadales bacterium]
MWVLAVILVVALLIPVAAILVDSPLGKSVARRMESRTDAAGAGGPTPELRDVQRKVEVLETEMEDLSRSVAGMREELQFMQRLLEDPRRKKPTS